MDTVGYSNKIMGNVLEVGCGVGAFSQKLGERSENVIGLDLDRKAINCAKSFNRDVDFVVGDAQHLPFKKDVFTLGICAETLEHVPDDAKALSELHKVTKGSGHLFVTVPNYISSGRFTQFLRSMLRRWGQPKDLHVYHYLKIRKLFVRTHLKIVEMKGANLVHFPFVNFRLRSQDSALRKVLFYLDEKVGRTLSFLGTTIGVIAKPLKNI